MLRVILKTAVVASVLLGLAAHADKPDFASFKDVKQKKAAFFDYMYPLVLAEGKKILAERNLLQSPTPDAAKLKALCEKYSKDCETISAEKKEALLKRVDVVPPSLALAQGANESAWGTSRFATKANNYFGQWCFTKGCGLVPKRRNSGAAHEVRKFSSPQQSVGAYIFNLNTGRVYADLRNKRAQSRAAGKAFNGVELAEGLTKYSERGHEYVKEVQSMIRYNKLVIKYDDKFWSDIEALAKK